MYNYGMTKNFYASIKPSFILFNLLCLGFLILFVKLGIWQIHRLKWKTNLINIVQERISDSPIEAPIKNQWNKLNSDDIAYLPIKISGKYLPIKPIYITTVSNGQTGYWQMAVFQRIDNSLIFINRGFVPMDLKDSSKLRNIDYAKAQTLTGILRLNEKSYGFLYKNKPEIDKWYKRNIKDMAKKDDLAINNVAPFFIDETKQNNSSLLYPMGGLTVINFPNSHLNYAITWFVLALGVCGAIIFININEFKK